MPNKKLRIETFAEMVDIFYTMVRKTMILEHLYIRRKHKHSNMIYPLLEEAKDKLHKFYAAHLYHKVTESGDTYVKQFLGLIDN